MEKKFRFPNPINLSNLFREREILSPERLLGKFSSFKKKGAKLVFLVKAKFDRSFARGAEVPEGEGTEREGGKLGLPVQRPKRCLCDKKSKARARWRSKIKKIGSMTSGSLPRSREPNVIGQPDVQQISDLTESPSDGTGSLPAIAEEELNLTNDLEPQAVESLRVSKDNGTSLETEQPEVTMNPVTPEIQTNLEEPRKSSMKSQRGSLQLVIEPPEVIDEIATDTSSLKIEEIMERAFEAETPLDETRPLEESLVEATVDSLEEVQEKPEIKTVVDEVEEPIRYKVVNTTRRDFNEMQRDSNRRVVRIDHKVMPPDIEDSSALPVGETYPRDEWTDVPAPVIEEIRRLTKPRRLHKCPKACPCRFAEELISMYHEARLLSSRASEIGEARDHCTFRMTNSEVDFFNNDTKMCSVMIDETRSRRAEMRELMDMWQEANEKLAGRKREIHSIVESIERTGRRIDETEASLRDWLPEGRMEKLRRAQRAIEEEDEKRIAAAEDEERTFGKDRIEEILRKRESRQEEQKILDEKRENQRRLDAETLRKATDLMQKYIDERKSLTRKVKLSTLQDRNIPM